MQSIKYSFLLTTICCLLACGPKPEEKQTKPDLSMDNLYAWCIVPFDNQERSPVERIKMLQELGFQSYVYDWRAKHLPEMAQEWQLALNNEIDILGVWMWIDAQSDQPGVLSEANEAVLKAIAEVGLKTQLWLGFHANYFEGLSDQEAVEKGVAMISYLNERAETLGCRVALYNHGDWFGEPENQVRIIKKIPDADIGIVYNFHHAHHQMDRFQEIVTAMAPYLWAVSLNGMQKDGPKILPVGQGDQEGKMLEMIHQAGFTGPYGVLGHIEDADVMKVLEENLAGLKKL